jgi:hypothetical protein
MARDILTGRTCGNIRDKMKVMQAAVTVGAPTYLYDRKVLVRWELHGLVYVSRRLDDFDVYRATDAGKLAFAKGRLP